MGFFDKKVCCLCNKETGRFFGRTAIADEEYVCNNCLNRTSSEQNLAFHSLKKSDIIELIEKVEEDKKIKESFNQTDCVIRGNSSQEYVILSVDGENGLWYAPHNHNGFVYTFDQVTDFWLSIDEGYLTDEEKKTYQPLDLEKALGDVYQMVAYRPNHSAPKCSQGHYISKLHVNIKVKHQYASTLKIPVTEHISKDDHNAIVNGFYCALKIFMLLANDGVMPQMPEETPEVDVKKELDIAEAVKKFKELLDMGVITQEEFDEKKNKLLGL